MTDKAENGDQMLTVEGRTDIRSEPLSSGNRTSSHSAVLLEMKAAAALCWQDWRWEQREAAKLHRRGAGAPGLSQLPWEWKIRRQQMQIAFSKKENEDLVTVLRTRERKQSKMMVIFK